MTRAERQIVLVLAIVVGLSRLLPISATLFDWDEALFVLGVREYEVTQHHPHPPGYPLFIAAAKAVASTGMEEFRSLQVIVVSAAVLIFPAVFFLARELGFGFASAAGGALLFAFLPNVWIYGGTAFSDIPGVVTGLIACTLLLRGRRNRVAYLFGAVILGIAAGIRPTNLLLGAVPALLATRERWRDSRLDVALAILAGSLIVAGSYAGAALSSASVEGYFDSLRHQTRYVREVDSWRNPQRGPLTEVAKEFFLWPVRQRQQMVGLTLLALVSLVASLLRQRRQIMLTFAIFAPMAVFAWLNLDVEAASRYAISYLPVHALLAADGLGILSGGRRWLQSLLVGCVATVFIVWSWPAVQWQRSHPSPPVMALEWAKAHSSPSSPILVIDGLTPHAAAVLRDAPVIRFEDRDRIEVLIDDGWAVDANAAAEGSTFRWPRNALWKILRSRVFEASVTRHSARAQFGQGWYDTEFWGAGVWRWMSRESTATLIPLRGPAELMLRMHVPLHALPGRPSIEVRFNGALLERFEPESNEFVKRWIVESGDGENELLVRTSVVVVPSEAGSSSDSRELGLRLDGLMWAPVR